MGEGWEGDNPSFPRRREPRPHSKHPHSGSRRNPRGKQPLILSLSKDYPLITPQATRAPVSDSPSP